MLKKLKDVEEFLEKYNIIPFMITINKFDRPEILISNEDFKKLALTGYSITVYEMLKNLYVKIEFSFLTVKTIILDGEHL